MPIRYTFLGDDFTGSTDVLEQLALAGVPAVLFLQPPTPEDLAAYPGVEAIGLATDSRSRPPEWMRAHLPGLFAGLRQFGAPVNHYKVCSTFDSSPQTGSIGCAIELGLNVFGPRFVPVLVGAPHLGRYLAFGNLFARAPEGNICRIDRHPMAYHPVTPMREPDLRLHLAAQTALPSGLVDLTRLASPSEAHHALASELATGRRIVLFDTAGPAHLHTLGRLLWEEAQHGTVFAAGSSGLTAALLTTWPGEKTQDSRTQDPTLNPPQPLLAVSGSCSPVTAAQIGHALTHGFAGMHLSPAEVLTPETLARALTTLRRGTSLILYTALGPTTEPAHGQTLGSALGELTRRLLAELPLPRVVFCGGDTSSHAVPRLGLRALRYLRAAAPGAPLCRADNGLEILLKGGQMGAEDFLVWMRDGQQHGREKKGQRPGIEQPGPQGLG